MKNFAAIALLFWAASIFSQVTNNPSGNVSNVAFTSGLCYVEAAPTWNPDLAAAAKYCRMAYNDGTGELWLWQADKIASGNGAWVRYAQIAKWDGTDAPDYVPTNIGELVVNDNGIVYSWDNVNGQWVTPNAAPTPVNGIDTVFLYGSNYFIVTTLGDTLLCGTASEVTVNGVHPTNPPAYEMHIDTAGVDSAWIPNGSTWVYFNISANTVGSPLFRTNNNFVSYFPTGPPPVGSFIINSDHGALFRRLGLGSYISETEPNGRNVRNADRYFETGNITNWAIGLNSAANLYFTAGQNATISDPVDINNFPNYTSVGSLKTLVLNNNTGTGRWARFGFAFRDPSGLNHLDSIYVVENSTLTLDFTYDGHDTEYIMRLNWRPDNGTSNNTNLFFTGSSSPFKLNSSTGNDAFFKEGAGITMTRSGDTLTVAASGGGGGGTANLSFSGSSSPVSLLSDNGTDVQFVAGANITFSQAGNVLVINSTAGGGGLISVQDQVNMLDISAPGGVVNISPNIPEGTLYNSFSVNDQMMVFSIALNGHRKVNIGNFFSQGFVDKVNNQFDIAGEKGFTSGVHFGGNAALSGMGFGTTSPTVMGLQGGTGDINETTFQNFGGLLIKPVQDVNGDQVVKFIATGRDAGNDSGKFEFYTRNNQVSANWVKGMEMYNTASNSVINFAGATSAPSGNVNVPSLGLEGGLSHYLFRSENNNSQTLCLYENTGSLVAYMHAGQTGWKDPSDLRLKDSVETLSVYDKIDLLRGVSYTLKSSGERMVGVIAQEMELAFPQIVDTNPETGMKGVSYSGVSAVGLQLGIELAHKYKALEKKVELLETFMPKRYKRKLARLEKRK